MIAVTHLADNDVLNTGKTILEISLYVGVGMCILLIAAVEGFGPLLLNRTRADKFGIHTVSGFLLVIIGFLIYGIYVAN